MTNIARYLAYKTMKPATRMARQKEYQPLNWLEPSISEVDLVGRYISNEGYKAHPGLGGSSRFDMEQGRFVMDLQPHQRLEQALKAYITGALQIPMTEFDDTLPEKISAMEKSYSEHKQGLFHRLWHSMGDKRELAQAWLDVIPDSYGVCVVKAGIAVIFKLAEDSRDKRERIFGTFAKLHEVLVNLHPGQAKFRGDPGVRSSATALHDAVVDAIESMIMVMSTTTEISSWARFAARFPKLRRGEEVDIHQSSLDVIIRDLDSHIAKYDDAVGLARDRTIENTGYISQWNAVGIVETLREVAHLSREVSGMGGVMDEQAILQKEHHQQVLHALREGQQGFQRVIECQMETRNSMMSLILELKRSEALKEEQLRALQQQLLLTTRRKAVVSLADLCDILAYPTPFHNEGHHPLDIERVFQHPSNDLSHALAEQSRLSTKSQGQVQSLLSSDQFLYWLSHPHPSLLLVDASIRESSLDRLSAISVLSSTLATSLMQVYPDQAVVIPFLCGMHSSPSDILSGPTGMMRSLIIQLLMKLDASDPEMREWNLDFISDRAVLQHLEEHSLPDLCQLLHDLLYQFKPDPHIYCIVDSISCFDVGRLLRDLDTVMDRLRVIINDMNLPPVFKILITNPGESTRAIRDMMIFKEDPSRIISLGRHAVAPGRISARVVDESLLGAPLRRLGRTPSPFRRREREM